MSCGTNVGFDNNLEENAKKKPLNVGIYIVSIKQIAFFFFSFHTKISKLCVKLTKFCAVARMRDCDILKLCVGTLDSPLLGFIFHKQGTECLGTVVLVGLPQ